MKETSVSTNPKEFSVKDSNGNIHKAYEWKNTVSSRTLNGSSVQKGLSEFKLSNGERLNQSDEFSFVHWRTNEVFTRIV
jgi:hypothetical protein